MRKWWHLAAVAAGAIACRTNIASADLHHALRNTAHVNALQQVALTDTCIPWRAERPDSIYLLQAMVPPAEDAPIEQTQTSDKEGFYIDELGFCNDPTCPCHDSVIDSLESTETNRRPVLEADSFEEALEATAGQEQGYTADNPVQGQSRNLDDEAAAIEQAENEGFAGELLYGDETLYGYDEDEARADEDWLTGNDVAEELNEGSDGLFDDPFGWEYGAETENTNADGDAEEGWIHQNLVNDPYPVQVPDRQEDADAVRPDAADQAEPAWIDYGEFDFESSDTERMDPSVVDSDETLYEEEWLREMADQDGLGLYDAGMTDEELREAYGEEPIDFDGDLTGDYRDQDEYGEYDEEELYEDWRSDNLPPMDEIEAPAVQADVDNSQGIETGVPSNDAAAPEAGGLDDLESYEPYSYDDFYSPQDYGYEDQEYGRYEEDSGLGQQNQEPATADEGSNYDEAQYDDMDYYDIEYYDATYDRYDEPDLDPMTYDSAEQMRRYELGDSDAMDHGTDSSEQSDLHFFYPGEDWSDYGDSEQEKASDGGMSRLFHPRRLLQIVSTMPYGNRIGALVEQAMRMLQQAAPDSNGVATAELANIQRSDAESRQDDVEQLIEDGGEFMCPYCEIRGWEYEALSR